MQRYKYIIVSSAVALALTAANISAQQGPAVPGTGGGGGGAGDASASNQSTQIALENKIATGTVGIATGIHSISQLVPSLATAQIQDTVNSGKIATGINAMAEVHSRIATSVVFMAANGVTLSPSVATSLVAIATGTDGQKKVQADIATSVVKLAAQGLSSDPAVATSLVAMVGFTDGLEGLITSGNTYLLPIATSAVLDSANTTKIATSANAIATGINAMAAVHSAIATSVVKMAAAGVGVDPAIATSTVQSTILETRIATAVVETAARQVTIASSVVALSDRFPDRVIGCTAQAVIATTATNYRQVIPAGAGQIIYVCSELWTVTQAARISFAYGQGTNCGIGPVDLTGEMSVAASSGASRGSGLGMLYQIPANNAFCVRIATASGGASIDGVVGYVRR